MPISPLSYAYEYLPLIKKSFPKAPNSFGKIQNFLGKIWGEGGFIGLFL